MTKACEFLGQCGFYRRFGERKSAAWRGLVTFYCSGKGVGLCERRKSYLARQEPPADHIMPSGHAVPQAFFELP